tara:strand:- start:350 stop:559 length:210 start_codon:yes stop_codon:yes gene_type:complete
MSWENEIKKEYGMPDNESRFDNLGKLQVMIDSAMEFAVKIADKKNDLEEVLRHLERAESLVFELTDKLM